jgi:phosphoribosylanthranilate isomerase
MRTRIKVCCIASVEEARLAIAAGADAIGCVGARPPSPRTIPDHAIAEVMAFTPPPMATFLLTTELTAEAISAQVRKTCPTAVQILQRLDPAELARLAELQPHLKRVQVIHVEGPEVLELIPAYAPHVHAFLLDSGAPNRPVAEFGGTGRSHDWALSAEIVRASPHPVFLAGGLSAANATQAVRQVQPFGLDLCTGVRTEGCLDADKLARFIAAVRRADDERLSP